MKKFIFIGLLANFATVFCTEQPQSSTAAPVESSDVNERKIPFFLSKAANISAPEGSTVRLGCRTENLGEHVQLWKFISAETKKVTILFADAHSIQRNRFADITLNSSSGSDQLVINSMSSDRQGTFCCEISTKSLTRLCHNVSLATGNEVKNQTLTSVEFAARTNVSTESPVVTSSTSVKPSLASSTTASSDKNKRKIPVFLNKAANISAPEGSTVRLECRTENLGDFARLWTFASSTAKNVILLYSGIHSLQSENRFADITLNSSSGADQLVISSMRSDRQGTFCCEISSWPARRLCHNVSLATGNEVQNQTLTSEESAVSTESPVVTSSTSVKPSLAPSTTASYLNDSEPMPEFITKSENYLVERSSIVNLECDVKNLGTYKRFWTHISAKTKQKTILYSQKFKITVENFENNFLNSSTYALKVFSLEPEQQGSFCCYINTLPATELCYGFQLATSPIAFPTVSRVTNETFGVCRCN